ncbi:MAG: hypothetical protein QOF78_4604 [Phycisphaerales bacterium]|nr:hypothetical protein [Phycisphaerales bacterium]
MAKLLVVEDDQDARDAIVTALTRAGHEVKAVTNGRDALEAVLRDSADLIVLDIRMPVMDGAAFMQVLRSYLRWTDVPVVVVTALPDGVELDRVTQHGVARVFKKAAYSLTDLTDAVAEILAARTPN